MSLSDKKGVIFGVANYRSFAWAIAKAATNAGAEVAITYQNERLEDNARKLASELPSAKIFACDLNDDAQIEVLAGSLRKAYGHLDFLVHSVAYAPREDLQGRFVDTSRDGFRIALETSAYSFVAAAKHLEPLLKDGASLITLSYLGGERVLPNYNVMGVAKAALESSVRYLAYDLGARGIRVNALSPGPVNTLAARGVGGFTDILSHIESRAPLRRNVTQDDVASTAVFFLSDGSRNITGEILYIDAGYQVMGM